MRKIYCAKDPLMIAHLRNVLGLHGIECVIRKTDLATGAGELPPVDCWPELWIVDEGRLAESEAILKKTLAPLEAVKKPWICCACGEEIEGQFSECWQCGRERAGGLMGVSQVTTVSAPGKKETGQPGCRLVRWLTSLG
jgi:hypothetical protein